MLGDGWTYLILGHTEQSVDHFSGPKNRWTTTEVAMGVAGPLHLFLMRFPLMLSSISVMNGYGG